MGQDDIREKLFAKELSRGEKALLLLHETGSPSKIFQLRNRGFELGLREVKNWNLSDVLRNETPRCALTTEGWTLTNEGQRYLHEKGLLTESPLVSKTRGDLERHVAQITDPLRRNFAEEAVICFNRGLLRAAVVLSWVGAIWIIENHIFRSCLSTFNSAGATRYKSNFKTIRTMEHFGRLFENEVLQLAEDVGLIDKSMKKHLTERLDLRNTCGHPNKVEIDDHTVAHHVEFLLNNVYKRYA